MPNIKSTKKRLIEKSRAKKMVSQLDSLLSEAQHNLDRLIKLAKHSMQGANMGTTCSRCGAVASTLSERKDP